MAALRSSDVALTQQQEVPHTQGVQDLWVGQTHSVRVPKLLIHVEHKGLSVNQDHLIVSKHSYAQFGSL